MSRVWDTPVHDSTRVRDVRVAAEAASARARLDPHRTAIAALVATELATNLLKHAGGGSVLINLLERPPTDAGSGSAAVQLVAIDHGPGIPDVAAALRDGCTTAASSLGAGLGTCVRISSAFDLYSVRGRGTVVMARIDQEPVTHRAETGHHHRLGGINAPLAQAEHSGDSFGWVRSGPRLTLMLADGLGHGAKAATASDAAVDELRRSAHLPPEQILRHLDRALRSTRGAAVAVAQLDTDTSRLGFAGVGNVGARMRTGNSWQPLVSHPGIVGAHFPARVPVQHLVWSRDSLLVLHSDGLPSRWTPPEDTDLLGHDPAVVAATILRDAGSAARPLRDDTSVAVLASDRRAGAHDRRT
ncbi:SpoIIE family protein phosphatase [Streptomyces sp. Go-475]|uniref:SpoIIE family protein phosphatase n=1 Tax=Streptomyces sp. Go-475 TaxID=2072505 RepID=UPI000DEF8B4A|nr:SpoIIE family protein phosphatase [Streptomyces sp. Go-475]AXE83830.1 Serine/threonine-protein kinase RsbT [Streptomyces sp. Go-475]